MSSSRNCLASGSSRARTTIGKVLDVAAVSEVRPGDHRDPEVAESVGDDLMDALAFSAFHEGSADHRGRVAELAAPPQLGEHDVDPGVVLGDVLDQHDPTRRHPVCR